MWLLRRDDIGTSRARARSAWRYFDGIFLPESARLEARLTEYERYAAGGRKRPARGERAPNGTFLMRGEMK
jgi:hypothetical protein